LIDIHCHILPGVDDGPSTKDESIAMARYALDQGIDTIIATPHALGGSFSNPPDKIIKSVAALQRRINSLGIPIEILPGCEVHFCKGMASRIIKGEATFLCKNRRYILVEFPFQSLSTGFFDEIQQLVLNGITPVIAHPERNSIIHHDIEILHRLLLMGCLFQVNSTSITGGFGDNVMACAHTLLELKMAHVIASDAHSPDHRPPDLIKAVKIAESIMGNKEEVLALVEGRPWKILFGEPIE
jgi:protein-tyrosine phosphatase